MDALQPGTVVEGITGSSYKILETVGQGSFGITYLAQAQGFPVRKVALKECFLKDTCRRDVDGRRVVATDQAQYANAIADMSKEFRALEKLEHPGVVDIREYFIEPSTESLFIVMPWLPGGTLREKMSALGGVPHRTACEWLRVLLGALAEVHENNITHRDIKPANIMFNKQGMPVLVDFGAALDRDNKEGMTVTGPYTGGYAAPEQMDESVGRIGPWTDFFGLAATWYEMLTGRSITCYRGVPYAPIESEDKPFAESIMKNLAADTAQRCQTAAEWLELLKDSYVLVSSVPAVNDVYDLIAILRERYPKNEEGKLPWKIDLILRMAEFTIAPGIRERIKIAKDALAIVAGAAGVGAVIGGIGVGFGWGQGLIAAVVAFFSGGPVVVPVVAGATGLAAIGFGVYHFVSPKKTQQQLVEETLRGLSENIRKENPQFWEENRELWRA